MPKISLSFSLFIFRQVVSAQTEYAVKLAETIMTIYKDSMVVKKFASRHHQKLCDNGF